MTGDGAVKKLNLGERILLAIDSNPCDAICRVVLGFAMVALFARFTDDASFSWRLIAFIVIVLLMLRLIPAVLRKLFPFSSAVQEKWAERRFLAKRYDSYQWKKLFWIGIGIALYLAVFKHLVISWEVVASLFIISGAMGLARWSKVAAEMSGARDQVQRIRGTLPATK
jgi:hypothetical protein